jgi:hypothetical protein
MCSGRSKFYASYIEELRNEASKARQLDLTAAKVPPSVSAISTQDVKTIIADLGFTVILTDQDAETIIEAIKNPRLPYG